MRMQIVLSKVETSIAYRRKKTKRIYNLLLKRNGRMSKKSINIVTMSFQAE